MHEKSLLLPLLPVAMMAAWEPELACWAPAVGALSMFPLLERDGLTLPYAALLVMHASLASGLLPHRTRGRHHYQPLLVRLALERRRWLAGGAVAAALALHALRALVPPPARLPWLWDRAFITLSYAFIAEGMVYLNWRQHHQRRSASTIKQE